MPLNKSGSKASVGQNIKTEMAAGKKQKQAVAIAFSVARKAGSKGAPPPSDHNTAEDTSFAALSNLTSSYGRARGEKWAAAAKK